MVDGINLPKTGFLAFLGCVEGADRDAAFQGIKGFGEAFPFQSEGFLVFFEIPVYGGRAYLFEFFRDLIGDAEGRPAGDIRHLPPHKRGEYLPALEPEKRPDQAEGDDYLVGVDAFPFSVGRPFFLRFAFYRLAVHVDQDLFYRLCV